jgi:ubiquinone/menaquinone biosynthesis C-methylase UbiE
VPVRERVFAALYDPFSKAAEQKFGAEAKRRLLANARGRVLEIGVGTGLSFPHYPADVELVGIDASRPMLRRAEQRAQELGRKVTLLRAPAEALPFEDGTFDTAVSLVVLCSVDDPAQALEELRRVLRPGGRLLFIEHVRSDDPSLARRQDRYARPWGWFTCGCHPNRDTLGAIEAAGFEVVELEREERPEIPKLVRPHVRGWAEAPQPSSKPA